MFPNVKDGMLSSPTDIYRRSVTDFAEFYASGSNTSMLDIFDLFDTSGNNKISVNEMLAGLSVMCKGSLDDKVALTFKAFDLDGDGYITANEIKQKLTNSYTWWSALSQKCIITITLHLLERHGRGRVCSLECVEEKNDPLLH